MMSKKLYFINSINEEDSSFEVQEVGTEISEKVYAEQSKFEEVKMMLAFAEKENEPLVMEFDLGWMREDGTGNGI